MEGYLLDWVDALVRWFHAIVAIAWVGTSAYFMWIEARLSAPSTSDANVESELWMVHSGGFYLVQKRQAGAGASEVKLPGFRWEAAMAWISGLLLLGLIFWSSGGSYLMSPALREMQAWQAIAVAGAFLLAGWLAYDGLWRLPLRAAAAQWISFAMLAGACYLLTQLFSGRAAFIMAGALLGTIMVGNVWVRIVPSMRDAIATAGSGSPPDSLLRRHARRAAMHNTYVYFPLVLLMLSHHVPRLHGHAQNWLILVLVMIVGACMRHFIFAMERRRRAAWVLGPVAVSAIALAVLTWPVSPSVPAAVASGGTRVSDTIVRGIVELRCVSCHSPLHADARAQGGAGRVSLDSPESIAAHRKSIRLRSVVLKDMPPGNSTGMTDEERALLRRWIDAAEPAVPR